MFQNLFSSDFEYDIRSSEAITPNNFFAKTAYHSYYKCY